MGAFVGSELASPVLSSHCLVRTAICRLTAAGRIQRVVLTGGPGAGKTTVLDVLRARGYAVGGDAARSIIRERKADGLSPRPEPRIFAEQILELEMATYASANPVNNPVNNFAMSSPLFLERGVVEVVGMLKGLGVLDEQAIARLIARYPYDHVLVLPPWEDIYQMDEERDHTFEHSVRVHESTRNWYLQLGYDVVDVPVGEPDARADFILIQVTSA